MFTEIKRVLYSLVTFVIFSMLSICPSLAANKPPAVGETLPAIKLAVPEDTQARTYLGLDGSGQFTIPQIKGEVVIIEIFNMY